MTLGREALRTNFHRLLAVSLAFRLTPVSLYALEPLSRRDQGYLDEFFPWDYLRPSVVAPCSWSKPGVETRAPPLGYALWYSVAKTG
ncbi:MAG: hypothetical protein AAFQ82_09405 [Myxococcota bacterium]